MPKIKFRAIERTDLPQLKKWRNELKDNFRQFRFLSDIDQENWFDGLQGDTTRILYAVEGEVATGGLLGMLPYVIKHWELIGVCGWVNIDWVNRHADLSIYVGTEFISRGFGSVMLEELHRIAFLELNLGTVRLEVFDFNPAKKLYERAGYKLAGKWLNAHYYKGRYWDSILMAMTREEYLNGRNPGA